MLTKLRIKNFKCLEDTGELDIRPLTFLVGPNSSGKSSLLQFLLMLRQTVDSRDTENPLTPNGEWVQLGAYRDFVFGQDAKRQIEVSLTFRNQSPDIATVDALIASFAFGYNQRTTRIILKSASIDGDNGNMSVYLYQTKAKHEYRARLSAKGYGITSQLGPVKAEPSKFHIVETKGYDPARPGFEVIEFLTFALARWIEEEIEGVRYLAPLRQLPQRAYVISGQAPMDVGLRGERTAEVLWYATRTREQREEMLHQVNHWLAEFGIAQEIKLEQLGRSTMYQVLLVDPHSQLAINLSDVGFGVSQVLPIIVQGFYADSGSLLLLEQPEIHLHPRAQATLGSLLVDIAHQRDRRLIVETHSEHLLGRVQRHIAEEKIGPQDVAIYYFNPTPAGTRIQEITLNELGQYQQYPEGFFEEGLEEAYAHIKAIKQRAS